ncbi:MAG: flagellin [Opitutales bacterium]|nr:flagellin [Opitutales bacterium]
MPIVVNSNASATQASFNLSRANDSLRKSLARLSSGNRINSPADDAGGLAVAYKLNSKLNRTEAVIQNSQNALSYLQVQDASLQTVGKVLDRMAELRTMAADITKNSGDIENYTKEFVELQSQLNQISRESFNGISLFSDTASAAVTGSLDKGSSTYLDADGNTVTTTTFSRQLITHPDGQATDGSISLNVVNLQFVLSVGNLAANGDAAGGYDLGNIDAGNNATGTTGGFINNILNVSVGQFTAAIEKLADARAENGAEQNRIMNSIDLLQTNMTNLEAAHGRIMDADIALESTRFARHNVLVQASAAMTAQANQLTNVALQLLG